MAVCPWGDFWLDWCVGFEPRVAGWHRLKTSAIGEEEEEESYVPWLFCDFMESLVVGRGGNRCGPFSSIWIIPRYLLYNWVLGIFPLGHVFNDCSIKSSGFESLSKKVAGDFGQTPVRLSRTLRSYAELVLAPVDIFGVVFPVSLVARVCYLTQLSVTLLATDTAVSDLIDTCGASLPAVYWNQFTGWPVHATVLPQVQLWKKLLQHPVIQAVQEGRWRTLSLLNLLRQARSTFSVVRATWNSIRTRQAIT